MDALILQRVGREEFDYPSLMQALSGYASPNDKITQLLRSGDIIRVKKGLYVLGDRYRRRPYSRELLANLIYGPSMVSLDYALSFHGLIPERVETVTSVAVGRSRSFNTPVGRFVYRPTPVEAFHLGMEQRRFNGGSFLFASPERALADKIREDRTATIRSVADAGEYLLDDLRLDVGLLRGLDGRILEVLAHRLGSRKVLLCLRFIKNFREEG